MWILISTLHILASLLLIALILLQQGKGADAGASFGGDSSSVFGPMVENPLKNLTTLVAFVFMATSVSLAYNQRFAADSEGQLFTREAVTSQSSVVEDGKEDLPVDSSTPSKEVSGETSGSVSESVEQTANTLE